jgi:uncharacterized protein (DUF362 family)/ferredoxin
MFDLEILECSSLQEVKRGISAVLEQYGSLFPAAKDAKILLKPNLNANMNALTGNTTDLRLLAAVIEYFQSKGYTNIAVAEGTNSGFYRRKINVISRLGVDRLTNRYGIRWIDLNDSEPVDIDFEDSVRAGVARECLEADLLINMPKLKTHFEVGMSVCLKNLMGCLVGQENKKKAHQSLAANILNLNRKVKPHLHIVDAMISMEGLGPTRGTPVRTDMILIGTDPYLIDLMCARMSSFESGRVKTLAEAETRGIIDSEYHRFVKDFPLQTIFRFRPPHPGPLARFIHHSKRQKYFLAVRNTPLFNYFCSTQIGGMMMYRLGLRQDVFIPEEMECDRLEFNISRCSGCGKCATYCPIGLDLPDALSSKNDRCIYCLYCFCVCPEQAIEFKGKLGFMGEQLKQYDAIVRKIA